MEYKRKIKCQLCKDEGVVFVEGKNTNRVLGGYYKPCECRDKTKKKNENKM